MYLFFCVLFFLNLSLPRTVPGQIWLKYQVDFRKKKSELSIIFTDAVVKKKNPRITQISRTVSFLREKTSV